MRTNDEGRCRNPVVAGWGGSWGMFAFCKVRRMRLRKNAQKRGQKGSTFVVENFGVDYGRSDQSQSFGVSFTDLIQISINKQLASRTTGSINDPKLVAYAK